MWKEAEIKEQVSTYRGRIHGQWLHIFCLGVTRSSSFVFHRSQAILLDEVIRSEEYHNLFKLMSTCSHLLNDYQGFQGSGGWKAKCSFLTHALLKWNYKQRRCY